MKPQNKKDLIMEAAEQEFLTKGYDGARTISIAQKAGVTHAMLHYYFSTKDDLFERILEDKLNSIIAPTQSTLDDSSLSVTERIKFIIEKHFDYLMANPLLPNFILNELTVRPNSYTLLLKNVSEKMLQTYSKFQADLNEAVAKGEIEQVNIIELMISIISLNVFPVMAGQAISSFLNLNEFEKAKFLSERKAENVEIIMRRIKKH